MRIVSVARFNARTPYDSSFTVRRVYALSGRSAGEQGGRFALLARAELLQRAAFDLADALARHRQALPDLLERVLAIGAKAVAETQYFFLAIGQRRQRPLHLVRKIAFERAVLGGLDALVAQDVAQFRA